MIKNPYDPEALSLMAEAMRSCLEMLRRCVSDASLEHGSVRGFCLSKSLQACYLVITPRAGDLTLNPNTNPNPNPNPTPNPSPNP